MLDTAQPMFILWGPSQTLLFNEAYFEALGKIATVNLGASLPEIWEPNWPTVGPFIDGVYSGVGGIAENVPLVSWARGSKEIRFYTFSYTPLKTADRKIMGASVMCADTTDRVQRLQGVEEERNKLLRLFREAPSFLAEVEGPNHIFSFANDAYREFVGRDVIGQSVAQAFVEAGPEEFIALLDHVFSTGKRVKRHHEPVKIVRAGGDRQLRFVDFICEARRGENNEVVGIFIQGHDVTEEVAAQKQVQLLQKDLIHLSRVTAMGAMASTLAHELNQPLTAIQNFAKGSEHMVERGAKSLELSEPLAEIRRNAARAGEIIRRLREMTRKGEATKEPFVPDNVIKEAGALATIGSWRGLKVRYDFRHSQPVLGDPIQIQQVLINLIRNACDAVADDGDQQVLVSTELQGDVILISVEDSGPGIPPEDLPTLFEAFFSTKDDGMGVGLSICRTIVEGHGGRIWAENRPEQGARFSFTLPIVNPPQREEASIPG